MTKIELDTIFASPNAAIIAPAGHGKTEMIMDIVEHAPGKQLLLTHTNAGVDAIEKRLKKRNISKNKYHVATIASFCIKWCVSYPQNACFNMVLSPLNGGNEAQQYYNNLYTGARMLFVHDWARSVISSTYSGVIVDEYQDCTQNQHEIFLELSKFLPVRVLGDPMQGIFGFAGRLVDWNHLEFPLVEVETKPWRWKNANLWLGEYLSNIRKSLSPILWGKECTVHIDSCDEGIQLISPRSFDGYKLLKELNLYSSVIYVTKWEQQQKEICMKMPGIFQYDEKQDCNELFRFAKLFDEKKGNDLAIAIINFMVECATGVATELRSFRVNLDKGRSDFSRITKHADFGPLLSNAVSEQSADKIADVLEWSQLQKEFKQYRLELLLEMIRSLRYAASNNISVFEAANHIRKDAALQKRYTNFKFLSSRTLLSKGLEFDCVIIDMSNPLSAKDFYVAMTRAMKKIYIISDSADFHFSS